MKCGAVFLFLWTFALADLEPGFTSLFNGSSLDGWISARQDTVGSKFSVDEETQSIVTYAGREQGDEEATDVLYTTTDYSHYILKLDYKWGEKRFAPRGDWERDAGLLFHITGELNQVWPDCIEMQIGESTNEVVGGKRYHTGDLFVIGHRPHVSVQVSPEGFYDSTLPFQAVGLEGWGRCWTPLGRERPHGEWNQIEIRVYGAERALFFLNGVQVLEIRDFGRTETDGVHPLSQGRIGFQAEWAEIYYRNIRIKELPLPE